MKEWNDLNGNPLQEGDLVGHHRDFRPIGTICKFGPTRVSVQPLFSERKDSYLAKNLVLLQRPKSGESLDLNPLKKELKR